MNFLSFLMPLFVSQCYPFLFRVYLRRIQTDPNFGHMVATLEILQMTQTFASMALSGQIGLFTQLFMVTGNTREKCFAFLILIYQFVKLISLSPKPPDAKFS